MFFAQTNYTTNTITTYGASAISSSYDVRIQEKPSYSIFVISYGNNVVAQYSQSRTYIRAITNAYANGLHGDVIENGNLYVGVYCCTNRLNVYTSTLGAVAYPLIATTSYMYLQYIIRYNSFTGLLYECDSNTGYLNAFTTGYAQVLANTIYLPSWGYNPICVDFYTTAAGVNLLYVGTFSNLVMVL